MMFMKCLRPVGFLPWYMRTTNQVLHSHNALRIRNFKTSVTNNHLTSAARCTSSKNIHQEGTRNGNQQKEPGEKRKKKIAFYIVVITACSLGYHAFVHFHSKPAKKAVKKTRKLPKYSAADVKLHNTVRAGVWVTLEHAVYDLTDYVDIHPGGEMILLAAGGSLEPFWEKYPVHKKQHVQDILDGYKIGVIPIEESQNLSSQTSTMLEKHPDWRIAPKLTTSEDYTLQITGDDRIFANLTIQDIKMKFEKHELKATEKCTAKTSKDQETPIWSGARLGDILHNCGVKLSDPNVQYIHFVGLDRSPQDQGFTVSVPVDRVLRNESQILLAYERNGQELAAKHGYPVRVIIPTETGFRSVKWLGKVVVGKNEVKVS